MILSVIYQAIFASAFTIGSKLMQISQPFFYITVRMGVAGSIILFIWALRRASQFSFKEVSRESWILIVLNGFFTYYIAFNFLIWPLKYLSAAKTCMITNLLPFFVAFFSYIFFHERITRGQLVGMLIGFVGYLPLLYANGIASQKDIFAFISWPELMVIGAVIGQALGWICFKSLLKRNHEILFINGLSMLTSFVLSGISTLLFESWPPEVLNWSLFIQLTTLITILSNGIGFNLLGYLLKHYNQTFIAFTSLLAPLFAALYDWVFFGRMVSTPFFLTFAFVGLGLGIFVKYKALAQPTPKPA